MPTYDYKCRSCGNVREVSHSIKIDDMMVLCECSVWPPMTKMPSAAIGVQFKGTGFYETEYKGK